jgi:hypothetical protein
MGNQPITASKQYCLAAGATQGNIAYTQNVIGNFTARSFEGVPFFKLKSLLQQYF